MVRSVVNNVEDDETLDSSSPRESKRAGQKGNTSRSKHSETEQRRRCKINERFQTLRDLIPESDQKRDKASFLLEVIQYIQFLHEKLQMYEGSCQGWSPEPTKLTPWKINSGPIENLGDQSHLERFLSGDEDVLHQTLLSNAQNSVESDLFKPTDNQPIATSLFETVPCLPHQDSLPSIDQLTTQQPRPHFWRGTSSCVDDCSVPIYNANEEELKSGGNGEASISTAYSQGLLNSLINALQSSGVDMSQANISVKLDVRKRTNDGSTATIFDMKDQENPSGFNSIAPNFSENYAHPHKRLRADQS